MEFACAVESGSFMARVHGLEHVERLAAANLTDDDAIGAHAERVANQVANRHFSPALDVRGPRLEGDDVRLRQSQLGRVLDGDQPSSSGMNADKMPSIVVFPVPAPPDTITLARPRTQDARNRSILGPTHPPATKSSAVIGSAETCGSSARDRGAREAG